MAKTAKTNSLKITKKINYDSMWLKVSAGSDFAKLRIGRGGHVIDCTATEAGRGLGKKISEAFHKAVKVDGLPYGEAFDVIESALNNSAKKVD